MGIFDIFKKKKKEEEYTPGFIANNPEYKMGSIASTVMKKRTPGYTQGSIASQFVSPRMSQKQLDTSDGLYNLAVQNGLQGDADRILKSQEGEEVKKIFSGGFISDIFDALNAVQYGVVGVLKGKSFAEGVKTRQSFADDDALGDLGLPGIIMGTLLDIAVDPFTYIAPYTILKKVPGVGKGLKAVEAAAFGKKVTKTIKTAEGLKDLSYEALEGGTKVGKYLASKFAWMFGADPIFRKTFEKSSVDMAVGVQKVVDVIRPISKLTPKTAAKMIIKNPEDASRFMRVPLEALKGTVSGDEFNIIKKAYNTLDDLGKQAVEAGLLSKGKWEENLGVYLKNAYLEYEGAGAKKIFGAVQKGIKGIKKRKVVGDISEFGLTQIDNPAYLMFKSTLDLTKDVQNAKMLKEVATKFGTDVAQDGLSLIPKTVKYGDLGGKYIPNQMKDYLTEIIMPAKNNLSKQVVGNFKFFKVVMNPATHARNIVSNKLLNWWKLGMNPLDPRVVASDLEAGKEIFRKGGKWIDEATPLGYGADTFAANELRGLLDSTDINAWGKGVKGWSKMKKGLGDIYQGEENLAKLSAYIFNRKKGIIPEEAWKAAESATFNYAQVTPFIRKLRESLFGMPFITFTTKATPVVAETMLKAPHRISVLGKIKNNIEKLSDTKQTARERASEPPWVKDGFYIKLPMKDKNGRSAYFDLTYILPFGDLISGNFLERNQDLSTGAPESFTQAALRKSPFIQLVSQLGKNKDFYGNSIWKNTDSSEKQLGDVMRHITKTYVPPLVGDQLPGGYNRKGERQQRGLLGAATTDPEDIGQRRNLQQELLRTVGAKIQPIDADIQETYAEWNRKKALQNLLIENGIGAEFSNFYQPKEE